MNRVALAGNILLPINEPDNMVAVIPPVPWYPHNPSLCCHVLDPNISKCLAKLQGPGIFTSV